ncbi:unnamed protein product [Lasius platythorax]|uniref:Thap domain-containing protein 9 n=2 Tax=Lasius TaxID=488720 RepID=A0A0J7KRM9_LASNI|nr:thap domain-containing protein 9 [Lasius niger]
MGRLALQQKREVLKRKSEEAGEQKLYACLTINEMAIRKQAICNNAEKIMGHIDHGIVIKDPTSLSLAKEALVYLITGVNQRWKIPVAYFLIASLMA